MGDIRPMPRSSPLALLFATLVFAPAIARADLPPPDGTRFVEYRFRVDGASKSPDYMIVVYPWSMSNGAPTREHTVAQEGMWVSVGRRSSPPELYAVKKADFEAFEKTWKPSERFNEDPAMDAFLAKGAKCNLAPSPDFTLSKDDPRDAVEEVFTVQTISDSSCVLSKGGGAATPPSDFATPPEGSTDAPTSAAPKGGGCAGCAVGEERVASGVGLLGVLFGLAVIGKRRKR